MNEEIELMMKIYNTYDVDWMADEIKSPSSLTRHHIVKKESGGENSINNYALLTEDSHHLLHFLEDNYYSDYVNLNKYFLELNESGNPPNEEYFNEIKSIIKRVKKSIKNKKRQRK